MILEKILLILAIIVLIPYALIPLAFIYEIMELIFDGISRFIRIKIKNKKDAINDKKYKELHIMHIKNPEGFCMECHQFKEIK